jgi:hypothetical protein
MLQGHTFRTLLQPAVHQHPLYILQDLFHGLTAPIFLVGAGLTFVIATRKRWEEYHKLSRPLARRLGRILLVLGLGIALHLPYFSLRKIISEGTAAEYLSMFQCDVLHCIGVGLFMLHGLIFFFRSQRQFYGLVLAAAAAIPLLTPLMWDVDFLQYYPAGIAQLFNSKYGSPFPLFPFLGFLLVGVIVSWEFIRATERERQILFIRRLWIVGPVLFLVGLALDSVPFQLYPTYNFWYTSPSYFAMRAGVVLVVVAAFWYLARFAERAPRWKGIVQKCCSGLALLGRESLLVYVVHMAILYGSVVNPFISLRVFFGATVNVWEATAVMILFLAAMLGLAFVWDFLKLRRPVVHRVIQFVAAAAFLSVFILNPY